MFRLRRLTLALALLLLLPTLASAQRDSRYTREATRFIGLAMTRADAAQQADMYRQALTHLQEGMERDGQNARVWLLAGTVYAALGQMQEADRAFTRAVEMHPEYAEEITGEREQAWIIAFNEGLELMDAQRYEEAIAKMEGAQIIYNQRPEALMNLGALYANAGRVDRAIDAFEKAVAATRSPLYADLDEETREMWGRYRDMAAINTAQLVAAQGVDSFNAENLTQAEAQFRRATELNPHARDYWFNHLQAIWGQVNAYEDMIEENPEGATEARERLPALYQRSIEAVEKTRAFDPASEVLYRIEAQAKRMMGELQGTEPAREEGTRAALAALERMDALPVGVDMVHAYSDGEGVVIEGEIRNRKAAPGSPIQIHFTLLSIEGREIGSTTITVNAPDVEGTAQFSGRVADVDGELAGWRYQLR
jgi:tetratricopeptide (TPR) repeat protein